MKTFSQFVLALGLAAVIAAISLDAGVKIFIRDVVGLQGRSIIGGNVEFQDYLLNWEQRTLQLNGVCLLNEGKARILCADALLLQMSGDFMPVFSSASFFPRISMIDRVEAKKITVAYDADDEGKNLYWLKSRVSVLAADAMRGRMNAAAKGIDAPLLFQVREMKFTDITVQVISRDDPSLSKDFSCENIVLTSVGLVEKGITASEIADQAMQKIVSVVQTEVGRRIEIKPAEIARPSTSGKTTRKKAPRTNEEDDGRDKGAGKDIKDLWKKTKSFFE